VTVAELIEKLKAMPQDMEVHIHATQYHQGTADEPKVVKTDDGREIVALEFE